MKNKNQTLFMIVGVLLVIVIGVSFAYFLTSNIFIGTGASTDISTGTLPIVEYDAGDNKLIKENLIPKDIITKEFKVIVTPTKDIKEVTYKIYINIIENTFEKCTEDNYDELENKCEFDAEELIYRLKDSEGNVINSGNLIGKTGQIEIIRETKTQEVKTEYPYTIEIEFTDTNKDQNHNANKIFSGNINVEFANSKITIPDIIAANNPKTTTPNFSQIADTNEGVFITDDPMYGTNAKTYYWRGAATTNYVNFAGFCWRIVRINGDGSIRLIYDGTTCHQNGEKTLDNLITTQGSTMLYPYNKEGRSEYVGWTYVEEKQRPEVGDTEIDSDVKSTVENWYSNNIIGTDLDKVADGKFCNDRNTASGSTWSSQPPVFLPGPGDPIQSQNGGFSYAVHERLTNNTPTLACSSGDIYTLNIGLIAVDEVMYAGGTNDNNTSYYLYNGQHYWTMSPYGALPELVMVNVYMYAVSSTGSLSSALISLSYGLRPVINLKPDTTFSSGDGTLNSPYIVS